MAASASEALAGPFQIIARLFTGRERALLAGVFTLGSIAAALETLAVASIVPFLSFVMDPGALSRYPALASAARSIGVTTPRATLLLLGGITVALVTVGNVVSALFLYVQQRFAARTETRLASTLFGGYLRQPYAFHTRRDAPSLMKVVLNDVSLVVTNVVTPTMIGVSRGLIAIGIVSLLFLKDPTVATVVMIVLVGAYWLVYRAVRSSQHKLGIVHTSTTLEKQRVAQESLGGVKELKVLGREAESIGRFERATRSASWARATNMTVTQLPRYVLEAVAFGGILLVTLGLIAKGTASGQALVPTLALYAFAGYRLMPALQQLFAAAIHVRFSYPMLVDLSADFRLVAPSVEGALGPPESTPASLTFVDAIRLANVSFTYADAASPSLSDVDLTIRPTESIGLVGRTGAGKTTLADLILGLYAPTSGQISVDGVVLTSPTRRAWQRRVGYVPQHVFLANASVAENIAFGLARKSIDHDAVRRAAELAQAVGFIRELSDGFETLVGERGVKLSGGQRQRIGIARALYHEPEVLVFDEATSALDGLTEDAVMEAIRSLSGGRTIILIAHRLRTVEACDRILMLEHGRVVADGPYHDLLDSSVHFRRLVSRTQPEARVPAG
jgi:ABC-type multidrug transport system fused ATPase/permease subunit